jgi:dynactin complex subunit
VANGAEHVDLSGLVALVDKLTQQNLELAGRVGFYQNELEHLRGELRALQAPATSNQPESAREPTAPAETISASRPWWRFW